MNYIISSIILLVVVIIIIYILSIDNNIDKIKNKLKEMFKVAKSKDINYINEADSLILLKYLKSQYGMYDNIMIPKKIFYIKENDYYIMKNIDIIGYNIVNDNIIDTSKTITIKFIPIKNELFIGQYSLFGINGNYYIIDKMDISNTLDNNKMDISNIVYTSDKNDKMDISNISDKNNKMDISNTLDKNNKMDISNISNISNKFISANIDKDINISVPISILKPIPNSIPKPKSNKHDILSKNTTTIDSSDMIPDIIHLSSDSEEIEINIKKKVTFAPL